MNSVLMMILTRAWKVRPNNVEGVVMTDANTHPNVGGVNNDD